MKKDTQTRNGSGVVDGGGESEGSLMSPSIKQKHKSMEFGKLYPISYLDINANSIKHTKSTQMLIRRSPSLSPNVRNRNFHYPDNLSEYQIPYTYSQKKRPGLLEVLVTTSPVTKTVVIHSCEDKANVSPERCEDTAMVIKLSQFPSAQEVKGQISPIERDDWPSPPATAVTIKNLVKAEFSRRAANADNDNSEVDDKMLKELAQLSKMHNSAIAQLIKDDLFEKEQEKKLLDPRSASRTPSASKEPLQPPRFESPINASPSRSNIERPRFVSDSVLASKTPSKQRTLNILTSPSSSSPEKAHIGVSKSTSCVPPGTPGSYIYDRFTGDSDDEENSTKDRRSGMKYGANSDDGGDLDSVFEEVSVGGKLLPSKRNSSHKSQSTSQSFAFLKTLTKKSSSSRSIFEGAPFINSVSFDFRKGSQSITSVMEDFLCEPTQPFSYNVVNLKSQSQPKGLDKNFLEKYLSDEEFETYLGMDRETFYKLPEFKRNDIKRRVHLF